MVSLRECYCNGVQAQPISEKGPANFICVGTPRSVVYGCPKCEVLTLTGSCWLAQVYNNLVCLLFNTLANKMYLRTTGETVQIVIRVNK